MAACAVLGETPGSRLFIDVLKIVPDDVGLLQEEAHVIGQVLHLVEVLALELAGRKELHSQGLSSRIAHGKEIVA